jgi:hypothetical protein
MGFTGHGSAPLPAELIANYQPPNTIFHKHSNLALNRTRATVIQSGYGGPGLLGIFDNGMRRVHYRKVIGHIQFFRRGLEHAPAYQTHSAFDKTHS